jgi:hypothetical protein
MRMCGRERGRREKKAEMLAGYGYEFDMPKVRDVAEVPERVERERLAAVETEEAVVLPEADAAKADGVKADGAKAVRRSKRAKGKKANGGKD